MSIYTDTNPITLPCSLARAGNNYNNKNMLPHQGFIRVLPRKNPQSGTRFDKVCHIAELEGNMLEGIYSNYYYRGNNAELGSKGQKSISTNSKEYFELLIVQKQKFI